MRNKVCILKKQQQTNEKNRLNKLLESANEAFKLEDYQLVETLLLTASELSDVSVEEKAALFSRIAGLYCIQGMYASAAAYYQRVVQLQSLLFEFCDHEMETAISNYRALLALSQRATAAPHSIPERGAVA
ncbi:MAG: hypothetical protein K2X77_03400 [Candidatus Obscuribacterales bacterium]|nr:hypothetical protein [Candidatus Obscuribacterales bacterium]